MALVKGKFDGGTTRASLGTILGYHKKLFSEITLFADKDNTGSVFWGPVTVTSVPANEEMEFKAGDTITIRPGKDFELDPDSEYVVGSEAGQKFYAIAVVPSR